MGITVNFFYFYFLFAVFVPISYSIEDAQTQITKSRTQKNIAGEGCGLIQWHWFVLQTMAITASVSFLSPSPSRLFCLQNHNPLSQPLFSLPFHSHAFPTFASPKKRLKPTAIPQNITPSAQASNDSAPMLPPYNVLITGSTKGSCFSSGSHLVLILLCPLSLLTSVKMPLSTQS